MKVKPVALDQVSTLKCWWIDKLVDNVKRLLKFQSESSNSCELTALILISAKWAGDENKFIAVA